MTNRSDRGSTKPTGDRAAGRSPLHVVTAFAAGARMVVGQRAVAAGENEITAARALLEMFDLKGVLVIEDALHYQGETARIIRERGGHWLFPLKDNHPALRGEVERYFDDPATALGGVWSPTGIAFEKEE